MIPKSYFLKIYPFLLGLIAFTLPFNVMLNNIAIGLLLLYWLATGHVRAKLKAAFTNPYFLLFAAVYFIQFFGLLYSDDHHDAFVKLEKRAGLFLIPLLILTLPRLTGRQLLAVILAFAGACCLLFGFALFKIMIVYGTIVNVLQVTEFIDDTIRLHHAYSGMYLVFAIITLVYYTIKHWLQLKPLFKAGAIVLIIVLYFFLLLLGARMALFISFISLGFLLILFTGQKRNLKSLAVLALVFFIGFIGVLVLPSTRNKLNEFLYLKGVYHPLTPRIIQWTCCFDIINDNRAWLQGVGTGDVKPKLQACYQEKKFWGHLYNYNAHNEYLEEMVRHGFIGLSIFLLSLVYPLVMSIRYRQPLYTCFLLIFMFVCISESVLNRQKGVVFYAFFNALLTMPLIEAQTKKQAVTHFAPNES